MNGAQPEFTLQSSNLYGGGDRYEFVIFSNSSFKTIHCTQYYRYYSVRLCCVSGGIALRYIRTINTSLSRELGYSRHYMGFCQSHSSGSRKRFMAEYMGI